MAKSRKRAVIVQPNGSPTEVGPMTVLMQVSNVDRRAQTIAVVGKDHAMDILHLEFTSSGANEPADPLQPVPSLKLSVDVAVRTIQRTMVEKQEADVIRKDLDHPEEDVRTEAQDVLATKAQEAKDFDETIVNMFKVGASFELTLTPVGDPSEVIES